MVETGNGKTKNLVFKNLCEEIASINKMELPDYISQGIAETKIILEEKEDLQEKLDSLNKNKEVLYNDKELYKAVLNYDLVLCDYYLTWENLGIQKCQFELGKYMHFNEDELKALADLIEIKYGEIPEFSPELPDIILEGFKNKKIFFDANGFCRTSE